MSAGGGAGLDVGRSALGCQYHEYPDHRFTSLPPFRARYRLPPGELPVEVRRIYNLLAETTGYTSSSEALAGSVVDRGLADGRLGIEVDGQTPARYEALKETLPHAEFLDCSNLIRLLRMVKSRGH